MANEKSWAASAASRRRKAEQRFWETVQRLHGDRLRFDHFKYLGATTPSTVTCVEHGDFSTKPTYLVNGTGCPACGRAKSAGGRRLGFGRFVEKATAVHGGVYRYPEQLYVNNKVKLRIVCPVHGDFFQKANAHLSGKGCPQCANDLKRERNHEVIQSLALTKVAALQQAFPQYDFSQSVYVGGAKKLLVSCAEHGPFTATPNNMLTNGSGCPHCGLEKVRAAAEGRRLTTEQWVAAATRVHKGKYTYAKTDYVHGLGKVTVTCPKHGDFRTAGDHIYQATGCPKCANQVSKGEEAVASLLSLFTPVEQRNRTLIAPKEVDILMPEKRLAVEYCGEYFHSHGDADHEAKHAMNHWNKYKQCAEKGYRLITVYESEWKERNYAIRRLLRNAIGKSKGKVMARKCELRTVAHKDAVAFYERYHPQGGAGAGEHYGLYWAGKLVACMRFTEGANDRGNNRKREWTLTRYATRVTVTGGASRLFNAFLKDKNPKTVKSFSDNRFFAGGMYEQLGFVLAEDTKPDYQVWHPKLGLLPKPAWQRRSLPLRAKTLGVELDYDPDTDPRTERDITYLLGARRIYDCGKKRWVWTKP